MFPAFSFIYLFIKIFTVIQLQLYAFLSITLTIQGILWFHANFTIFFYFCEKYHWNIDIDFIESIDGFG